MDIEALAISAVVEKPAEQPTSAQTVDFVCDFCDAKISLPGDTAGKRAPCPECKRVLKVPLLQKTAPRDWRKPEQQVGPSGVKRADAGMDGSWGTQASAARVSQQALKQAKAIKEVQEPVSVGRWVKRGVALVALLVIAWIGWSWYGRHRQANLESAALELAEGGAAKPDQYSWTPTVQAEFHAYLGRYYQYVYRRSGKQNDQQGRTALMRVQLALQTAQQIKDPIERIGVVRELIRQLIAIDAEPEQIVNLVNLTSPPPARLSVVRELTRTMLTNEATVPESIDERVAKVSQLLKRVTPLQVELPASPDKKGDTAAPAANAPDTSEQAEFAGILAQTLLTLGQQEQALAIAEGARPLAKTCRMLPVNLAAVLQQLNRPALETEDKDADRIKVVQIMASARSRNVGQVRALLDANLQNASLLRLHTLIRVAAILVEQDQKDDAIKFLNQALPLTEILRADDTQWERQRLVELASAASSPAEAEQWIAKLLPANAPATAWARLTMLRQQWSQRSNEPLEAPRLDTLPFSIRGVVAFQIAHRNARLEPAGTASWAESVSLEVRPFAAAGSALGIAESQK